MKACFTLLSVTCPAITAASCEDPPPHSLLPSTLTFSQLLDSISHVREWCCLAFFFLPVIFMLTPLLINSSSGPCSNVTLRCPLGIPVPYKWSPSYSNSLLFSFITCIRTGNYTFNCIYLYNDCFPQPGQLCGGGNHVFLIYHHNLSSSQESDIQEATDKELLIRKCINKRVDFVLAILNCVGFKSNWYMF